MQASFIINLGNDSQVPIISFTATSPSLTSLRSEYFVRATLNDSSQVKALTAVIQAFGWRNVVPIYVDDDFGEGIIPSLTDALNEIGTQIHYRSVINPSVTDQEIVAELYKLMTMQTRVFVLHMTKSLGSRVLNKAQEVGMMSEGYVWIVSNGITNTLSFVGTSLVGSFKGVIGVKPYVPRSKMIEDFILRWKGKYSKDVNVDAYGLWAYDATTSLAMAVEKVGYINFNFKKMDSSRNSVNLGKYLRRVISSTRFNGLSGDFHIVNGQLQSSIFEIINGIGDGERVIGFWTKKNGFVKELNSMKKVDVGDIIWPGESTSVPKGWVIPTNGKKLRIGIPVKDGFSDFVKLIRDPSTNTVRVTGFCIDVFEAVLAALPYDVPFDYIPFAKPDGSAAGSYDELVYQVFLGNFDAVVGDVTIRANRSRYVDFTLPFTESEEQLVNNLSRLVVIIWCFVVLILIQSYTASLTSTLTIKQLEPTFTSAEQLIEKGKIVGYPKGSFVEGLLRNSNISTLMAYKTRDELHIKFSKGEIGAAFDEIPYMKLFLAKHCSKYTMVFPKGSPLVPDVSRAVLRVTEGEEMAKIEKAWFGKQTNCPDPNTSVSSSSLGVNSFWGLFVIVGVAASFALIIFTSMLVYENRITLMRVHPVDIWKNIINIHFTTNSGETDGTNTDSVETTVRPNLSNNEEETVCNQENQNGQMSENIVSNPQVVNSS
ncbi:hypothetical protein LguiA_025791 [Lonicera macranthoides]